ncbi:hypothetical protein AYO21_02954 [Fonsecaea monophora]|uniref:T6SS Phospholipase effector Tle1-like catalytic domain-containing protein n=1 Tax=Fonsecaea monophora TaxID=254056 RepID=A0A177FG30_9EURO|nr:hypothetical protein AYO21_02954 [Fonsecaea monophora]OAG42671.1 hypothetical protein AYO21_02954 [Fonsecaea monophora]
MAAASERIESGDSPPAPIPSTNNQPGVGQNALPNGQKKKIIVCCDGTGKNEILEGPLSNVSRISRCITPVDLHGVPQVVYYQPGLGTDPEKRQFWNKKFVEATGEGINEAIREAYSFICHNYSHPDDEIYLFGYSRGAFTVRCIAQLINDIGLLKKAGLLSLPNLFTRWATETRPLTPGSTFAQYKNNFISKNLLRNDIHIRACAVWDTVASIGIPRLAIFSQPPPQHLKFVNSELCPKIDYAFQAIALHEYRRHFRPILWRSAHANQTLKQCWFLGYHGDVGGGRRDGALAHFALVWMMDQLKDFLNFDVSGLWISPGNAREGQPNAFENLNPVTSRSRPRLPWTWGVNLDMQRPEATLEDSMANIHWAGGRHVREPRRDFWDGEGIQTPAVQANTITSNEVLHFSVRMLLAKNVVNVPLCLTVCKCEQVDHMIRWTIESCGEPRARYTMAEDTCTEGELRLLRTWLDSEDSRITENRELSRIRNGIKDAVPRDLAGLQDQNVAWTSPRCLERQMPQDHTAKGWFKSLWKLL